MVNAWLKDRKDYMTVTFESMGFSDKEYIQFLISTLIGFKWQGFGSAGGTAGLPLQHRGPHGTAGRHFLQPMKRPCWSRLLTGTADHGKDLHWSWEKVWGGRSNREELLRTDLNPHSTSPCIAHHGRGGRGVRNEGLTLVFVSQYPTLF